MLKVRFNVAFLLLHDAKFRLIYHCLKTSQSMFS